MTEQSLAEREDIAEDLDADNPGAIVVLQVDEEAAYVHAKTWCDEGLCVVVVHDNAPAIVLTPTTARELAKALYEMATRVERARSILAGAE